MRHIATRPLETERLLLRRFAQGEAQAIFESWTSDPRVTRFLTWPAHASVDVTQRVLDLWLSGYERADCYRWAITDKESGRLLGIIDVVRADERTQSAEVGYCLAHSAWGQGFMTEALRAVSAYLLDEAGFNRVCACHHPANPASGRVMQKAGLQYEGIARMGGLDNQGRPADICWYAILRNDPRTGEMKDEDE